jgi:hypothetical protein
MEAEKIAGSSVILVRCLRVITVLTLLLITGALLWPAYARAADNDGVGKAYTTQATEVARKVVLAALVKHPERIHRMSMKCTFQLDKEGHPGNVKVVSSAHNQWAEDTARRALASAKFPAIPKSVIQESGSDVANIEYQIDLNEPR